MTADVDVAVVGAGPGGAATAIACARAGLRVALLERSTLPRDRPGETLHPGVEAPLRELGVLARVCDAGFPRHAGIWLAWDAAPRLVPYGAGEHGPWHGFQAWRPRFDALLAERAQELGAVVHERCRALEPLVRDGRVAGLQTSWGELRARHVVDGAGGGHWIARRLGLELERRSPPLIARFGYVEGACPARDDAPAIFADGDGWTWSARVGAGLYGWTRLTLTQPQRPADAAAPAELAGLAARGGARSADVSWRALRRPAGAGYVAVGDAAVVLDPASSHGVLRALLGGLHAARLICAVRAGGDERALSAQYGAFLASWFEHDVSVLRALYGRLPDPPAWLAPAEAGHPAVNQRRGKQRTRRSTVAPSPIP